MGLEVNVFVQEILEVIGGEEGMDSLRSGTGGMVGGEEEVVKNAETYLLIRIVLVMGIS